MRLFGLLASVWLRFFVCYTLRHEKKNVYTDHRDNWMSTGASAGAGSGDCHHYLQGRRAEIFRLEKLQEESDKAKKDKEWEESMKARIEAAEAEKAKKAEKRNKQKQKRKAAQEEAKQEKALKKAKITEEQDSAIHTMPKPELVEETKKHAEESKAPTSEATPSS